MQLPLWPFEFLVEHCISRLEQQIHGSTSTERGVFLTPCEVLIQCVQSFPFKMIYWAVVSVFKDSSIKFQYYFYKFKEFFQEYFRPVRTMLYTLSIWNIAKAEKGNAMTICPLHRAKLGLGWARGASTRCRIPTSLYNHEKKKGKWDRKSVV